MLTLNRILCSALCALFSRQYKLRHVQSITPATAHIFTTANRF